MVNITVNPKGLLPYEIFNVSPDRFFQIVGRLTDYARYQYHERKAFNIALLTSYAKDICTTHEEFACMCACMNTITNVAEGNTIEKAIDEIFKKSRSPFPGLGGLGIAILEIKVEKKTNENTDSAKQPDPHKN